jgi:hypothetical protein
MKMDFRRGGREDTGEDTEDEDREEEESIRVGPLFAQKRDTHSHHKHDDGCLRMTVVLVGF